jgi:hypothetical protein
MVTGTLRLAQAVGGLDRVVTLDVDLVPGDRLRYETVLGLPWAS